MELKYLTIFVGCVAFGILFSTTSSQSTLCIGYCGTGAADPSCTNLANYKCLNSQTFPNRNYSCCPVPPERCIDHNVNCPTWAANGYCNNSFWNAANELGCRKSCGFCTVTSNTTCFDQNITTVAYKNTNYTLCQVWARNGFCGSSSFYSTYIKKTCNASCGCTPLQSQPLSLCSQLAGRSGPLGPCTIGQASTGGTCVGTNNNFELCAIPGIQTQSLTCASIHGQIVGPCDGTAGSCPAGSSCICETTGCQCCATPSGVRLQCNVNIGYFAAGTGGPTLTCQTCSATAPCSATAAATGECLEGCCCQF